jgi:hypothetical protein
VGELVLDFLEEGRATLRSAPQRVTGSASLGNVSVAANRFDLSMMLSSADVSPCGFNASVRLGLQMLAAGKAIAGGLRLDASSGEANVELRFNQGTITVRGRASLSPYLNGVRGDVAGGTLELGLDQGNFSCSNLMDFAFTVRPVP